VVFVKVKINQKDIQILQSLSKGGLIPSLQKISNLTGLANSSFTVRKPPGARRIGERKKSLHSEQRRNEHNQRAKHQQYHKSSHEKTGQKPILCYSK